MMASDNTQPAFELSTCSGASDLAFRAMGRWGRCSVRRAYLAPGRGIGRIGCVVGRGIGRDLLRSRSRRAARDQRVATRRHCPVRLLDRIPAKGGHIAGRAVGDRDVDRLRLDVTAVTVVVTTVVGAAAALTVTAIRTARSYFDFPTD